MCDGEAVESDGKRPLECTFSEFTNKKEFEAEDHVCKPTVKLRFRLTDDPQLGIFEFQSCAWSLITEVSGLLYELQQYDGPVAASPTLEPVEFESGGKAIRFTKPVVDLRGNCCTVPTPAG